MKQVSANQWDWQNGRTSYSVRLFPDSQTLIWSVWTGGSEGPQFGDGIRQTFDRFLEVGVPDKRTVPDDLVTTIEARITAIRASKPDQKRGWRFWKR